MLSMTPEQNMEAHISCILHTIELPDVIWWCVYTFGGSGEVVAVRRSPLCELHNDNLHQSSAVRRKSVED